MRKEMEKVVKYDFVDLGLSVKWGNKNVGSDKMEGYGKYFSWNELVNEKEVDWVDYCGEDDVEVLRGSKMPTEEEIDELINKCSWNWEELNGVKGFKVSSKVNKNWIFIPAGGCMNNEGGIFVGIGGYYLSSTMGKGRLRGVVEMVFGRSYRGKNLAGTHYKRLVRLVK